MDSAWVVSLGCRSHVESTLSALAGLGRVHTDEPAPPAPGVVFAGESVDRAADLVASASGRGSRVLVVIRADTPVEAAWRFVAAGAADVLREGPSLFEGIAARLGRALVVERALAAPVVREHLVGVSPAWRRVLRTVVEAAMYSTQDVLILGETGTGKEMVARLVHTLDPRRSAGELVTVDCTAFVGELMGSELFGHERGAYTGAHAARSGAFALAHRGSLLLDEVGEIPPALQARLLRVLQEKQFKPLGSDRWRPSEFRTIAATHRDLLAEVDGGGFRRDLLHRLAGVVIRLPPLSERRADIPLLARHILARHCPEASGFDPMVEAWLVGRDWPGNVRELEHVVRRLGAAHSGFGPVTVGAIPMLDALPMEPPGAGLDEAVEREVNLGTPLRAITSRAAALAVDAALRIENGDRGRAASRLGITLRAIQERLRGDNEGAPASLEARGAK